MSIEEAARAVVDRWEKGDLAEAVRWLAEYVEDPPHAADCAYRFGAGECTCGRFERIAAEEDDEPVCPACGTRTDVGRLLRRRGVRECRRRGVRECRKGGLGDLTLPPSGV